MHLRTILVVWGGGAFENLGNPKLGGGGGGMRVVAWIIKSSKFLKNLPSN